MARLLGATPVRKSDKSDMIGRSAGWEDTVIDKLHEIVDRFFDNAVKAMPDQFECAPGCIDCCLVDLSVFGVEAKKIRQAFGNLPPGVRSAAALRASEGRHCCMIDPVTGRCIVYAARPTICRSHGMTILIDGRLDHCPKNYTGRTAERDCILDVEKLNGPLVSINLAAGYDDRRVRLADIAMECGGSEI